MVQFQVWSQVDGDDVGGGDGCLSWPFSSGQWGGGAAPARAGVGSDLMCLLVFFQNSHHTHFFLPVAKSRVLSYRKCLIREIHVCGLENYPVA